MTKKKSINFSDPQSSSLNAAVDAGNAAVVTLSATAGVRHYVTFVRFGYYADPNANTICTITDTTANTVLDSFPVTKSGPGIIHYGDGLPGGIGNAVQISLGAGGQIKSLCVGYR